MGSARVYLVLILIPVLIIHENSKSQSLPLNAQGWVASEGGAFFGGCVQRTRWRRDGDVSLMNFMFREQKPGVTIWRTGSLGHYTADRVRRLPGAVRRWRDLCRQPRHSPSSLLEMFLL